MGGEKQDSLASVSGEDGGQIGRVSEGSVLRNTRVELITPNMNRAQLLPVCSPVGPHSNSKIKSVVPTQTFLTPSPNSIGLSSKAVHYFLKCNIVKMP